MKIYVCSECGWFPSVGRPDRGFPFSFFIRALGSTVGRGGSESAPWRANHKAPRLPAGRETVRKACQHIAPGGAGASPRLPQPGFVSPLAHPSPFPPPHFWDPSASSRSLLFALLVCGNAPFLWPLHPPALCFPGFPGKDAPWPGPTPPPQGARFGDSGESVRPRPTPELEPPALPAPRLAHAKACCVIPTWADIPCPGRSGVGLLIILSAADPRHQPIYCPVSPRWFQEGEGSVRKGEKGTANRRRKAGTSYWHSKQTMEFGAGRREDRNGAARQQLLRELRISGSVGFSSGLPSLRKHWRNASGHWVV